MNWPSWLFRFEGNTYEAPVSPVKQATPFNVMRRQIPQTPSSRSVPIPIEGSVLSLIIKNTGGVGINLGVLISDGVQFPQSGSPAMELVTVPIAGFPLWNILGAVGGNAETLSNIPISGTLAFLTMTMNVGPQECLIFYKWK